MQHYTCNKYMCEGGLGELKADFWIYVHMEHTDVLVWQIKL